MPVGWTPKSASPFSFTMGQALAALITGQPDGWLSDWLHMIPDQPMDTASLCTNFDLNPPPLVLADFSALLPTSALNLVGVGAGTALTMLQLQDKIAHYVA